MFTNTNRKYLLLTNRLLYAFDEDEPCVFFQTTTSIHERRIDIKIGRSSVMIRLSCLHHNHRPVSSSHLLPERFFVICAVRRFSADDNEMVLRPSAIPPTVIPEERNYLKRFESFCFKLIKSL